CRSIFGPLLSASTCSETVSAIATVAAALKASASTVLLKFIRPPFRPVELWQRAAAARNRGKIAQNNKSDNIRVTLASRFKRCRRRLLLPRRFSANAQRSKLRASMRPDNALQVFMTIVKSRRAKRPAVRARTSQLPLGQPRRRKHRMVADELGIAILSGEHAPGAVLPSELEASVTMGVSRSAYREAIRTLAAKGMVESRPKAGTRVTPRSRWHLLDPEVLAWIFQS